MNRHHYQSTIIVNVESGEFSRKVNLFLYAIETDESVRGDVILGHWVVPRETRVWVVNKKKARLKICKDF